MSTMAHRENFLEVLFNELLQKVETEIEQSQAFVHIAAEWLGYGDLLDENFVDGSGDLGVDFWYGSEDSFDIFQVKSHQIETDRLNLDKFDNEGVHDLSRAYHHLINGDPKISSNLSFRELHHQWEDAIKRRRMAEPNFEPLGVNLCLVLFGDGLTQPADQELTIFENSVKEGVTYRDIPLDIKVKVFNIDDILSERWRQYNREWKDKLGTKRQEINLTPEGSSSNSWLSNNDGAVFYCRGIDLVTAYEELGYQIFEPNVRAYISKSKVNHAIRESLKYGKSREEFKYLNNGVTIICNSFKHPNDNRPHFSVIQPGVINGLQTISALHESYYKELDLANKAHFEKNCFVLVRLLREKAVKDINKVVIASNTQNPMQPRNLKSNNNEQVDYEKLFAQIGWFYERKQGAWQAFSSHPDSWRTLRGFKKSNFQFHVPGRKFEKVLDNEILGQTWLAFIGFSNEAVHEKKHIFEDQDLYELIFLHRTKVHASCFNYEIDMARNFFMNDAPSPSLMLVAYLANRLAKSVTLSSKETREAAFKRQNIKPNDKSKPEIEAELIKDDNYVLDVVLSGMSFIFTEYFGYMLYKTFSEGLHNLGSSLLANGTLRYLYETNDFNTISQKFKQEDSVDSGDILPIAWFSFRHCIYQLMATPWKSSFLTARSRTRFIHHPNDTRLKINQQLDDLNKFMGKSQLTKLWAACIPEKTNLYSYFASAVIR